ncbi:MAG: polysaccharide biosynthesis protein [Lachnospiraceae bacterium]|nr:polysaccharide biosynthesis protein [Lachnospiraceae bacterium]
MKALRKIFLIFLDICSVVAAAGLGLLLRFDFNIEAIQKPYDEHLWKMLPFLVGATLLVYWLFKLYDSIWNYVSVSELERIVVAAFIVSILNVGISYVLNLEVHQTSWYMPRSFYFIFSFLLILSTCVTRFGYRAIRMIVRRHRDKKIGANVMVVGAGEAGNMLIKEIMASDYLHKNICCIIDDSDRKVGSFIQGVKIVGNRDAIESNVEKYNIKEIIVAIPSADKKELSSIVNICQKTGCHVKILPGICEIVNEEGKFGQLRDVQVEDLLGRDPIVVDLDSIMGYVTGRVVMVTGGGGSIGSELCRQLADHGVKQLIIVDIYENNAYAIQQELIMKYPDLDLVVLIASVRNTNRLKSIFEAYKPEIVYHAAAHKHVPLMEVSPNEAVKNNVFGTLKTVKAADAAGVEKFVLISTDKAVNPTNIMGATKRICEMIVQTYNKKSKTDFVAVRFGNVLGSNGSVIPLFKKQIEAGGPVTVTHPDIIRYFMTIPEAVSLVLQAGAFAKGGEIFVLDMGEPVKILDLAENLIRMSGFVPYQDIDIKFSGLRPGEKLYEELLMDEEGLQDTENKLIHIGKPIKLDEEKFLKDLDNLYMACLDEPNPATVRKLVGDIVPTYKPKNPVDAATSKDKKEKHKVEEKLKEADEVKKVDEVVKEADKVEDKAEEADKITEIEKATEAVKDETVKATESVKAATEENVRSAVSVIDAVREAKKALDATKSIEKASDIAEAKSV